MKNLLDILASFKSLFSKENFEAIIDSLAITNYNEHKGSYIVFWTIATFSIAFFIWSSFAKVDQVVRASGTVVPISKVHTIQSRGPGVVEEINIKMSDEVEKGDVLFLINHANAKKRYELAKATRDVLEKKVKLIEDLVKRGSEAEIRLIDEQLRFYEAEKAYKAEELTLKFSKITAPVKGTISKVNVLNTDQVVQSGEELASIVPYNDKLQVTAKVQPKDIAYVIPDLKAKLAFTAYDMSIFGQFDGTVTKVAPSTTKVNINDPLSPEYYETIIIIDKEQLNDVDKISLQSGMEVEVSIIGQDRTVLSYITNPITKLSKTALRD